ncbi:dimethylargininase [Ilumatobacter sp.]|uniref:dimethylargininase n=1 Tax=Ilumatobacter sp. TaxID=1967498 RepID=UPI003C4733A0
MTAPLHDQRLILVRRPSPHLADGEVTHIERAPVDIDLAMEQWATYVDTFRRHGWDVIELDSLDDHPDGVFVEDTVVMYGDLAVITRPGTASRLGEIDGLDVRFRELGYEVARIDAPGTLDGGDVMKVGSTIYVGIGGRTNQTGIDQLREHVARRGAEVIAVPTTLVLHLKSAVTSLPDGTVIGYAPVVDDPAVFEPFLPVPEEPGAHVVVLGDEKVLMTARTDRTAALLAERGYEVVVSDISEFEKLEGCVTCLSVRLRTAP